MVNEWICSVDVESDGPCPGKNSMLSLGAAIFDDTGKLRDSKVINFAPLLDATSDPETQAFWDKHQQAYAETRKDLVMPVDGVAAFCKWVREWQNHPEKPTITPIGYRVAYDAMFLYYYIYTFGGKDPFSKHGAQMLDLKSHAAAVLGLPYKKAVKGNFPKELFDGCVPHSHLADQDAIEQGQLYFNLKKWKGGTK